MKRTRRALRYPHRLLPAFFVLASGCGQGGSEYQPPADWVYRPPAQVNDGWESASAYSTFPEWDPDHGGYGNVGYSYGW